MRVLITSGGTTENIDQVRGITNFASGSLGKILCEKFLDESWQVILLAGKNAVLPPDHDNLQIITITDTYNLDQHMKKLVPTVQAVIHTMAVSDYKPLYMTDFYELEEASNLADFLDLKNTDKKISSSSDYQVLFLKKNPKIISKIKDYKEDVILIGFKLLVGVSKEELLRVARMSLKKNRANYIFANDLDHIYGDRHMGYLLDDKNEYPATSKKEIADLIFDKVSDQVRQLVKGDHK
ncbi:phosphopantothenate--cysteine ligase [Streptococcaceae bacterium ESL0729]|nr:phosphopantothenate--cysteine ligase [Streptococcaceae bacterium ESL0729]